MAKIRLAVIGCGGFVRWHMSEIDKNIKGFRCVALVDPLPANAQRLKDGFEVCKDAPVFTDHLQMLETVEPDAVLVSTPHTMHFRHCYDALSAGAHVMVEKPMVTDSQDARKLVRKAQQKNKILLIAVQGCFTDTFAYARDLLDNHVMGDLQLVTGILAQDWLHLTRGKWRQDPELSGGGQLYDSTSHVLNAMMFLVNNPVREVFCLADNKDTRVDINAVGVIRFANGAMATITSGGNCPAWKSHLVLQGSNALMEIGAHGGDFIVSGGDLKKPIIKAPHAYKSVKPARNFHDSILGKDVPRCPGRVGIMMADLMDGLYKSVTTRKPVRMRRGVPAEN